MPEDVDVSPKATATDADTVRRGLVLGAGGILGGCWSLGALQALESTTGWDSIDTEAIVGTSIGSVLATSLP